MSFAGALCAAALILVSMAACAQTQPPTQTPPCGPPQPAAAGWSSSFVAGCLDRNGRYAGGSQIIHLVTHKGQLYAGAGYWKDAHNSIYGGSDPRAGWAQVLRLSAPDAPWVVDFDLGPRHLRPEILASVTFTQDSPGRPLPAPETLLIAGTYDADGRGGMHVYVRDDGTGSWTRTDVIAGDTGKRGEDNSARATRVYRDRVTGREHLFLSVGVVGLFRADYDPTRPGRLAWARTPEFVPSGTRILGLAEANGSLFVSEGSRVFRRTDGPAPRYEIVADLTGEMDNATDRKQFSAIGGIRALTAIAGPVPGRQSLLLMWNPGRTSKGCVVRLDPQPDGSFERHQEECLARLVGRHVGATIPFTAGAYNRFMPITDPASGERLHIVGLESFVPIAAGTGLTAHNQRSAKGGMYAGAMYALRDAQGLWRVGEVNGKFAPGMRELVSVYTYALSPFGGADAGRIYLGGYDPDDFPSTDTAWVSRTELSNLLRR